MRSRKWLNVGLVLLLLCAVSSCSMTPVPTATPKAIITAEDYVACGDATKISFRGSTGNKILWRTLPVEEELRMFELRDGDLLYLPNQYGVTNIILVAVSSDDASMAVHAIHVGPGPEPGPDPGPNPQPDPQPGPSSELTKLAKDLAMQHITDNRVADGKALGDAIAEVCQAYSSYASPKEFREGIQAACHKALDLKVYDWAPVSAGIANAISNKVQQGKITTVKDYADAWSQVAAGFQNLQ